MKSEVVTNTRRKYARIACMTEIENEVKSGVMFIGEVAYLTSGKELPYHLLSAENTQNLINP